MGFQTLVSLAYLPQHLLKMKTEECNNKKKKPHIVNVKSILRKLNIR